MEPRALRSPGWVKCRSHRRLSLERRRYVGHGNASCGAGGKPRVVSDAGQGGVPRHRCALGKRRRGRECRGVPRWRRPEMGARHGPGPSGRWAPLGLRQRQKTTAGAARPAAGGRALIDALFPVKKSQKPQKVANVKLNTARRRSPGKKPGLFW